MPTYRNVNAPPGKHWCYMHNDGEGAYLDKSKFNKNHAKYHGLESRCRECSKRYRKRYEVSNGKRNQRTKTLRIPVKVHALLKRESERREVRLVDIAISALKFYFAYGCMHKRCTKPRTATGMCEQHTSSKMLQEVWS